MIDLRRVRVFHAVVVHGTFSAAAAALEYTQPAVSHHVSALERELGQRLVNRSTRPLSLTAAGERLYAAAHIALAEFDRAERDLAALAGGSIGTVRLGSVVSGLRSIVPTAAARFRKQFPEIELTLEEDQPRALLGALRRGDLDIAIVIQRSGAEPLDDQTFAARPLLEQQLVLAVPTAHRLAKRRTVRLADLGDERWIMPARTRWADFRDEVDAALALAGITPHTALETTDDQAGGRLVAVGEGIALVPSTPIAPTPGVAFMEVLPTTTRQLLAVSIAGPVRTPVRALMEILDATSRSSKS